MNVDRQDVYRVIRDNSFGPDEYDEEEDYDYNMDEYFSYCNSVVDALFAEYDIYEKGTKNNFAKYLTKEKKEKAKEANDNAVAKDNNNALDSWTVGPELKILSSNTSNNFMNNLRIRVESVLVEEPLMPDTPF